MAEQRHQRAKARYRCQLPIVVSGTPKAFGPRGVTRDVSEIGIFFYTDFWHADTSSFEFRTVMPPEITQSDSRRALCRATVVRIEEGTGTKIGVAARIDQIVWM